MNIVTKALATIGGAIRGMASKAAITTQDMWGYARRRMSYTFGWATSQGIGGNSLVYACIDARASALASVQPEMRLASPDGKGEVLPLHPLTMLLEEPNQFHTWEEFIYLTCVYKLIAGEGFWQIGKNGAGMPVELWLRRPDWVEVYTDPQSNDFITHYVYTENGKRTIIPLEDMVHHRRGVNPLDPRHGLPPLAAVMAEVGLDGMATEHVTALLDNYAIPPVHVKVKGKIVNQQQADEIKGRYMARLGGPKRGEPLVSDQDTEITVVTTTPQQMELPDLRRISESRICAVFNVPPIVVGALVGLEHGTYSNYAQAREAFWDECVGADLRELKGRIKKDLQARYFDARSIFGWNLADVRALQEDQEKVRRFYLDAFRGGAITRNQFLTTIGDEEVKDGDYYLIPSSTRERKEGEFPEPIEVPQLPPGKQPTPLRQLPAPTGTEGNTRPKANARKSAQERLSGMTLRLREQLVPGMEAEIEQWFLRLGARVERRAREITAAHTEAERASDAQTAIDLDVHRLITSKDIADLAAIFSHHYALVLELSWDDINAAIGAHGPFAIADPFVEGFTARSASRVVDIGETTRDVLRANIQSAQAGGHGVDDLIRGVYDKDTAEPIVKRLRDIVSGQGLYPGIYQREYDRVLSAEIRKGTKPAEADIKARDAAIRKASNYRALNIARTELGYAANAGAVARYKDTGLVLAVRVHDGDGCGWRSHDDPDKANGSIRPMEEAEVYTLAHPSCQRAFSPVTDPAELPNDWGMLSA